MNEHRNRVADLWDAYISAWLDGDEALDNWLKQQNTSLRKDLALWQASYKGRGKGAIDLSCFPDPFTGDLRGIDNEPLLVVLGLNPGIGYPELQARNGIWANRVRRKSFSKCFDRSPPGDKAWLKLHGKESLYWRSLIKFGQRWCSKNFRFSQILNFELYPWHSTALTSPLNCPSSIIDRYVFQPLSEVKTQHIFAFGKAWYTVCQGLGLSEVQHYGDGFQSFPGDSSPGWEVVIFKSAIMTAPIIVSWQRGYAGPPGVERLKTLRAIINNETLV